MCIGSDKILSGSLTHELTFRIQWNNIGGATSPAWCELPHQCIYKQCITRSRRNPRSRCAWLTGPEPRSGYARTSFGIDAVAEVTISKCNLWKSRTLKLTSEFSHAHLTISSTVWDTCWFYQDHASRRDAKLQKIYQYFVWLNRKVERKKKQHFKESLIDWVTLYMKSSDKIKCAINEILWQTKIINP